MSAWHGNDSVLAGAIFTCYIRSFPTILTGVEIHFFASAPEALGFLEPPENALEVWKSETDQLQWLR